MMISHFLLFLALFIIGIDSCAQKKLRIIGNLRVIDIENHTELKYRKKGRFAFSKGTLADMRDSILFFSNGDRVKFGELAGIKIKSKAHLPGEFQKFFFYAGFGLIPLSMLNNVITQQPQQVTNGLVYISAGSLVAGGLFLYFRTTRTHIGKSKVLRIIHIDHENLTTPAQQKTGRHGF